MDIKGTYILREGKTFNDVEEHISNEVMITGFAKDVINGKWNIMFAFVFKGTDELTTMIHPYKIIDMELFEEYFIKKELVEDIENENTDS